MTNQIILARIRALYLAETIDAERVRTYVVLALITRDEAEEIIETA